MSSLRIARALLVTLALVTLLIAASAATVLAQDPTPVASGGVMIDPLDPRAGAGANRVGAPLLALVAVIAVGSIAAIATALYVRATRTR